MASSAISYSHLYESAQQAIKDAAATAGIPPEEEAAGGSDTTRLQQDSLKHKLDRFMEEANHGGSRGKQQQPAPPAKKGLGNAVFDITADEVSSEVGGDAGEERQEEEGQADECLGVMAEAFADDLDLLRKDKNFRGSATNLAAMAAMMK